MIKVLLILFFITFTEHNLFSQYSEQKIKTDSSQIKIIRNSVYRIYEETYTNKDSIWYSVYFIKDTTQLNTEGWKRKNGEKFGIWKEYTIDKQLLYTWDHDEGVCEVNKDLYPYHDILEKVKLKCDSLIIAVYSRDFFDRHVKFDFNCYAYRKNKYLGSWTEPLEGKPSSFKFRYKVKLKKSDDGYVELGMDLDSLGNYVPSKDDFWNNYGFEKVDSNKKKFVIEISKAIETAKTHGLNLTDTSKISEFLTWENFKKQTFYNGQFRYYITDFTGSTSYTKGENRKGVINRYDVYIFNPWTGDYIEKKKMKTIDEWEKYSGYSTGLLPDD